MTLQAEAAVAVLAAKDSMEDASESMLLAHRVGAVGEDAVQAVDEYVVARGEFHEKLGLYTAQYGGR